MEKTNYKVIGLDTKSFTEKKGGEGLRKKGRDRKKRKGTERY